MPDLVEFPVAGGTWSVNVPDAKRVPLAGTPAVSVADPRELVRLALASPIGLDVPLYRGLTPDDRVAVVLDETLPHRDDLLSEVLAHLDQASVPGDAVTVILPPGASEAWIDQLPDHLDDIHTEVHDPADPRKVAFLGPILGGRNVYLNRTLVEADFIIVLSGRRFDAGGVGGAEGSLFPPLSNADTLQEAGTPAGWRAEAKDIAWRLGTPCFVQILEGPGGGIAEVIAGIGKEATNHGEERQRALWERTTAEQADLVVIGVNGGRIGPAEFATAIANASTALAPDGRLVLITDVPFDRIGQAFLWLSGSDEARVFVASGWDADKLDGLGVIPLGSERELARLIESAERVILLPDAEKVRVNMPGGGGGGDPPAIGKKTTGGRPPPPPQ